MCYALLMTCVLCLADDLRVGPALRREFVMPAAVWTCPDDGCLGIGPVCSTCALGDRTCLVILSDDGYFFCEHDVMMGIFVKPGVIRINAPECARQQYHVDASWRGGYFGCCKKKPFGHNNC